MPDTWMTVAEAAATIKVHPRTIERRMASGKMQSRRADDGQMQVLITTPDPPDIPSDSAFETVRDLAADQVTFAKGSASALVKFAQEDANRAREEICVVRQDAGRARRAALIAWCVVGAMGIGVCFAVGWTSQKIAAANGEVRHSDEDAERAERQARQLQMERDQARQDAEIARLASAQAAGRLSAYVEQAANRTKTKPSSFVERIASAFGGE